MATAKKTTKKTKKKAAPAKAEREESTQDSRDEAEPAWPQFIAQGASDASVKSRFCAEISDVLSSHASLLEEYACLALLEPEDSIDTFEANQLLKRLSEVPNNKSILLILLSRGGSIEPAYQIAKLFKTHQNDRFIVALPREAKSAATLVALGADEIHMGQLSHLGPIDPQLGGLPALGVTQALERIAGLAERFPGSAEMFAKYLKLALTVEQIGYCERVSESAAQYAERLLTNRRGLASSPREIAQTLVYKYKDHGFVIDVEEATQLLGESLVKTDTKELALAEQVCQCFEQVNTWLSFLKKKRIILVGTPGVDSMVMGPRGS